LKENKESKTQLNKYFELKTRLEKTGMSMDDPELFVQALEGARKFKVNPERVAMLATNFEASAAMQATRTVCQLCKVQARASHKRLRLGREATSNSQPDHI
jgi:hypothetical protein